MFVVMSGKHKKDYKKVFKTVKSLLPTIIVKTVAINFEAAMWSVLPLVFPGVKILGCYFHLGPGSLEEGSRTWFARCPQH